VADTKSYEGMDERLHVKSSASLRTQENGFLERPTCVSIVLDKQSNLNYDPKLFSLNKEIT
jgi:hypothetical protein